MNQLQICVGCLVTLYLLAFQGANGHFCDLFGSCLHDDDTIVSEKDYIFEKLHTHEFLRLQYEAYKALKNHYLAFIFIRAISPQSKDLLTGGEICKTELEQLVGYFKNGGNTLCLVMFPELQAVNKATCCQSECCGRNTRCQENSHVNHNYLVYCDAFYSDPNGAPIGDQSVPPMIDEDGLTIPGYDGSGDIPPPVNQPTLFNGYFAIHHDTFPSVCTCKTSHC